MLKELGRGGMGVVYLARNKLMNRPEVLKVVNPRFLHEPGAAERFLREIRAAARLSHPNIVTAYTALQLGELLVLAMEYVAGEDLAQVAEPVTSRNPGHRGYSRRKGPGAEEGYPLREVTAPPLGGGSFSAATRPRKRWRAARA